MAFPTTLPDLTTNNAVIDGTTKVQAKDINNINTNADAVFAKVGVDGSAVTTSLDYKTNRQGVQTVTTTFSSVVSGSTQMVYDNTIPQNTEGAEFMTRAITPTSSANILEIEVKFWWSSSSAAIMIGALFQDSTANAIAAGSDAPYGPARFAQYYTLKHRMTAGATSSTTFKFRAGQNAAHTMTMNGGTTGGAVLGGVMLSSIKITEWKV